MPRPNHLEQQAAALIRLGEVQVNLTARLIYAERAAELQRQATELRQNNRHNGGK